MAIYLFEVRVSKLEVPNHMFQAYVRAMQEGYPQNMDLIGFIGYNTSILDPVLTMNSPISSRFRVIFRAREPTQSLGAPRVQLHDAGETHDLQPAQGRNLCWLSTG